MLQAARVQSTPAFEPSGVESLQSESSPPYTAGLEGGLGKYVSDGDTGGCCLAHGVISTRLPGPMSSHCTSNTEALHNILI